MADFELNAELREDKGKGSSRRLRRQADMIPAIIYGAGKEPLSLAIAHKDIYKACETEAFFSHILTINAGGTPEQAILKDLQRHPAKDRIMHADFLRVRMDQEITVEVPLHFANEDNCLGVKQHNGMISRNMTSLEITCLPGNLPEYIEIDVENMDIGDVIHMSEVTLPEGVVIPSLEQDEEHEHDHVVVSVNEQKRIEEDEDLEGEVDAADVPTTSDDADDGDGDDAGDE